MATLLFYDDPVCLDRETHQTLHYSPTTDYSFTRHTNAVPLTGAEFFEASRDFPIFFNCGDDGDYFPIALLSLLHKEHRQINSQGNWTDSYIPAFIRQYPFALTDEGTVCFDQTSRQLDSVGINGEPLFNDDGETSETLSNIIQFLNSYSQHHKLTKEFSLALKELDLLAPYNLQVAFDETQPLQVTGLHVIDEKKLASLPKDKVNEWFQSGWLAWIYAHIHSISAVKRLIRRQTKTEEKTDTHAYNSDTTSA